MTNEEREHELMKRVDTSPHVHQDSTPEEEALLEEMYGEPDADGFYSDESGETG